MAITKSAKKAIRNSAKKRVFNLRRSRAMKNVEKEIKDLVKENKIEEAKKMLPLAYKKIDKSAKGNTIKANTASRKKSRLSALIKKADSSK